MKDSTRAQQDGPTAPVERPSWRFSGRRGTPVHLREQAPQTLPPEIRSTITELARERSGERAPASDARPARAASAPSLRLQRDESPTPPVAAAPLPVERRSGRDGTDQVVGTSPIPPVEAPAPAIEAAVTPDPVEPAVVDAPADAPADAPTEPSPAPEPTQPARQPKLTAAERKKRAKAKAKAKAKARRTKQGSATGSKDAGRRLFARGRDVAAEAAAEVEPTTAAAQASTAQETTPPPPVVDDLPDALPSLDAIAETEPPVADIELPVATPEPASSRPEPILGTETASQAAWELGRLPILLTPPAEPQPPVEPDLLEIPAASEPMPAPIEPVADIPDWRPAATPRRAVAEPRATLQPMQWRPVDSDPSPAPIEPTDLPPRSAPEAIDRLAMPLDASAPEYPPARAREDAGHTAASRTSEARRRIARRRAELDDVVHMLSGLGSSRGADRG